MDPTTRLCRGETACMRINKQINGKAVERQHGLRPHSDGRARVLYKTLSCRCDCARCEICQEATADRDYLRTARGARRTCTVHRLRDVSCSSPAQIPNLTCLRRLFNTSRNPKTTQR